MNHFFILLISVLFITSCDTYETSSKERTRRAERSKGDIVIGVVDTSTSPSLFTEGVKLAIKELNQRGVLGRRFRPIFYDDKGSVEKGQKIAVRLAENTDVIAVVGHRLSDVAVSASITYEENGIVFISPGAAEMELIKDSKIFTFRNTPSDEEIATATAAFARRSGYMKMAVIYEGAVIYERAAPAKRLADLFYESAIESGIDIVTMNSYSGWEKDDFRLLIADLMKDYKFSAIFLGGSISTGPEFIRLMRDMGLMVPVISTNHLDSQELFNIAGKAANNTIVSTIFDPRLPNRFTRNFVKRFRTETGSSPDTWAAQGYDAIRLLASAIRKGGSGVPIVISTTLRSVGKWQGVTGSYVLRRNGGITEKSIFFKRVRNGRFEFLERELEEINLFEELEEITLRLPVEGSIPTIDPAFSNDMTSIEIAEQLFLGLTDFDPKTYQPVPELAESWTVENDGRTYKFKIRSDVTWTDGVPVTAHDVVWSVQRNIRPETKCPSAHQLYILKNARQFHTGKIRDISEVGVRATDDFTVTFDLEYSSTYFPAMAGLCYYRPVPKSAVEQYKDRWTEPGNIQSNGSYKLEAWEKGLVMILRKNPSYFDADRVSIPEVRYYIVPESSVGMAMYKNNQLDIMGGMYLRLPLSDIPSIQSDPVLSEEYYSEEAGFYTYSYVFNTKLPPVDNPLVRRAISASIDRRLLIDVVTKGYQEPATTFSRILPVGEAAESGIGINFDPVQAKEWLAQAGYPDGKGFPEITFLYNESETHAKIAKAIRMFLEHYLNITVRIKAQKWEDYKKSITEKLEAHAVRYGWSVDYPDANNSLSELFHPKNSYNIIGWDNEEFAELMDLAKSEKDIAKRMKLYERAEQILCDEECAVVPLFFETAQYLVKPRVKGWYHITLGGQHIRNWYLEQ